MSETSTNKPTHEQLVNEDGLRSIHRIADDSWRHGAYITQVFVRDEDATFWQATYRLSGDGETNELAEGLAEICQVEPYEVKTTAYRPLNS